MSASTHEPVRAVPERRPRSSQLVLRELWAGIAIVVIWLAVLFDAVFGPDIVTTTGGSTSTVPSAVAVALFGSLATWAVARYGFGRHDGD